MWISDFIEAYEGDARLAKPRVVETRIALESDRSFASYESHWVCTVSLEKQAEKGVSLEAQSEKIRAMATVQVSELVDIIVEAGESAKNLNRPGVQKLLALVDGGKVEAVIVAKLDRFHVPMPPTRHRERAQIIVTHRERDGATGVARHIAIPELHSCPQWISIPAACGRMLRADPAGYGYPPVRVPVS